MLLASAALATIAVTTVAGFAGPVAPLVAWLGGSLACGLVLYAAGDRRATRATVAMIVLLPAAGMVSWVLLLPLLAVAGGSWAVAAGGLVLTGLTPLAAVTMAGAGPGDEGDRLDERADGTDRPRPWLAARLAFASSAAAVVVAGHLSVQLPRRLDGGFAGLLVLDLLPLVLYAALCRRPSTVVACGTTLLTVTAGAWLLFALEDGNQFAGLWVFVGWTVALVVAAGGAMRDHVWG